MKEMQRLEKLRVQCYASDEGRPLGGAFQEEPPNHPERLRSRALVLSVFSRFHGLRENAQHDALRRNTGHCFQRGHDEISLWTL